MNVYIRMVWAGAVAAAAFAQPQPAPFEIHLESPIQYDGGDWIWFHPRAAAAPGAGRDGAPAIIMTLQHHLNVSDYYGPLHYMRSDDLGKTWRGPAAPQELGWEYLPDNEIISVCDVTPGYHAPTRKIIAIGIRLRYRAGEQLLDKPQSHAAAYAVYDPATDKWTKWRTVDVPDPDGKFFLASPGCTQWIVEDDGSILLPLYFRGPADAPYISTVFRCGFDGATLTYLEHGDELALDVERGLCEPSIIKCGGRYFLTIRNDVKGYVTTGADGLHWAPIRPWTFDDGQELGSYNTQQHWLAHGDALFLCYTRRGANNDHVFRHRAPLFIAQVDPEKLHVIRSTERVLIPERGATFGNFGAAPITGNESWVTDAEGMFGEARRRGAEGAVFVARVRWKD